MMHIRLVPFLLKWRRSMTKPTKLSVRPVKTQISWAAAQSDQSLRCPPEERLDHQLRKKRTAKTDQTGWMPRSSLGAHVILLVLSCSSSFTK